MTQAPPPRSSQPCALTQASLQSLSTAAGRWRTSVTFLLAFWPPGEAARLLLDIKHAVGGGKGGAVVATVHADCVDEWLLAQLQPLATTVIDVARESSKRIYPKICTVTHRYKLKSLGT